MGLNRQALSPEQLHVYKGIQAYNKRLAYAKKQFGNNSPIVKEMVNRADFITGGKLTKAGGLSETLPAIDKIINENISLLRGFDDILNSANVDDIIEDLTKKYDIDKKDSGTGKKKSKKDLGGEIEKEYFKEWREDLINEIFYDIYNSYGTGAEEGQEFNEFLRKANTGEVNDLLEQYKIDHDIDKLINNMRARANIMKINSPNAPELTAEEGKELADLFGVQEIKDVK